MVEAFTKTFHEILCKEMLENLRQFNILFAAGGCKLRPVCIGPR